ncbi:small rab-related gtpase [Anaeramoeba ignava]|uniref:Small rab-related gtpase n=1 Tax=Anaeramoeba ignava TaxID=1746090 RepID=A0A9Q0LDQ9_ANAIG|nr:small rab-related gtpase [Anaeramoeba ignava]
MTNFQQFDEQLNILLVGFSKVGKSSLILRFIDNTFDENPPITIGFTFKTTIIEQEQKRIKLKIWHSSSQEKFISSVRHHYGTADAILVIYDITNLETFEFVKTWMEEIEKHSKPQTLKILIGNKADLRKERIINYEVGKKVAESHGYLFYETSSKDSVNVETTFRTAVSSILQQDRTKDWDENAPLLQNENKKEKKEKKGCC